MSISSTPPADQKRLADRTYYRGRVAMTAILRALGVGPGDRVATQAFTCAAVPEGIVACGATPQWIDIERDGCNMDPGSLASRLTPDTRAVVVQHTFGVPAAMPEILRVAGEAGVPVIEDCCHTFTSKIDGRTVGSFGVASFYSFEWGKPLVVGIGGSAVANDPELGRRLDADYAGYAPPGLSKQAKIELQRLAYGVLYRPATYWTVKAVFNRLSKLGVAEGNYHDTRSPIAEDFSLRMAPRHRRRLVRLLARAERHAAQSDRLVRRYREAAGAPGVCEPSIGGAAEPVYSRFPLRTVDKDRLLAKARESKVELAGWYHTPVHPLEEKQLQTVAYELESCPNAEKRSEEIVSLPLHGRVGRNDTDRACSLLMGAA